MENDTFIALFVENKMKLSYFPHGNCRKTSKKAIYMIPYTVQFIMYLSEIGDLKVWNKKPAAFQTALV